MTRPAIFLENQWPLFKEGVRSRTRLLSKGGIWQGLQEIRINNWLRGFENYSDVDVGIILLDNLIYRSNAQVLALLAHAFTENFLLSNETQKTCLCDRMLSRLVEKKDRGILVAPVVETGKNPAKSGPGLLRMAAQYFRLDKQKFISADYKSFKMEKIASADTLLLFDDFAGTGTQFCRFLANTLKYDELCVKYPKLKIIYIVAAIHQAAMDKIRQLYPCIEVYYGELLTAGHNFLSDANLVRYGQDAPHYVRETLKQLSARVSFPSTSSSIGEFLELNLCYGFEHGTPNNTMPVFWVQNEKWHPLLVR